MRRFLPVVNRIYATLGHDAAMLRGVSLPGHALGGLLVWAFQRRSSVDSALPHFFQLRCGAKLARVRKGNTQINSTL
jgi:hypothetical protein